MQIVVDVEVDLAGSPLNGVPVVLGRVERQLADHEVFAQSRIPEPVDPAPDAGDHPAAAVDADRLAEDLDQADLPAPFRCVFDTDQPGREHRPCGDRGPAPDLDPAEPGQEALQQRLFLGDHQPLPERLLPLGAADRTRPVARLHRRDAQRRLVELRAPHGMRGRHLQDQLMIDDPVGRCCGRPRAPGRQVGRQPTLRSQCGPGEVLEEHARTVCRGSDSFGSGRRRPGWLRPAAARRHPVRVQAARAGGVELGGARASAAERLHGRRAHPSATTRGRPTGSLNERHDADGPS